MNGWTDVKGASEYCQVCQRTIREWMKRGLRYAKTSRRSVRMKYVWLDEFLESFEVKADQEIDRIVDETLKDFQIAK